MADDAGRMQAIVMKAEIRGNAGADRDLQPNDIGRQHVSAGRIRLVAHGQRRRQRRRRRMHDRQHVGVVEIEAMRHGAVDDGGVA